MAQVLEYPLVSSYLPKGLHAHPHQNHHHHATPARPGKMIVTSYSEIPVPRRRAKRTRAELPNAFLKQARRTPQPKAESKELVKKGRWLPKLSARSELRKKSEKSNKCSAAPEKTKVFPAAVDAAAAAAAAAAHI
eukprot:CAMPEP_0185256340 /NCGR_PEP_ID=MMETSP1359-20130426/5435_1 /TAXON_ID=552665 /ORGANISM="Bigelowiella longifila, Strain CCMP242" /LENGTH=134 /DNA_ID=CAMNT_0027840857 /DNA_START=127 /DNA_END=532 /DNA_ORIENTATION=-